MVAVLLGLEMLVCCDCEQDSDRTEEIRSHHLCFTQTRLRSCRADPESCAVSLSANEASEM